MRMNLPEYHGSIVEECPMEFIDEAYRIVAIMGVPQEKKADLGPINSMVWPRFGMNNG